MIYLNLSYVRNHVIRALCLPHFRLERSIRLCHLVYFEHRSSILSFFYNVICLFVYEGLMLLGLAILFCLFLSIILRLPDTLYDMPLIKLLGL